MAKRLVGYDRHCDNQESDPDPNPLLLVQSPISPQCPDRGWGWLANCPWSLPWPAPTPDWPPPQLGVGLTSQLSTAPPSSDPTLNWPPTPQLGVGPT